jgi:hypothetical protein
MTSQQKKGNSPFRQTVLEPSGILPDDAAWRRAGRCLAAAGRHQLVQTPEGWCTRTGPGAVVPTRCRSAGATAVPVLLESAV